MTFSLFTLSIFFSVIRDTDTKKCPSDNGTLTDLIKLNIIRTLHDVGLREKAPSGLPINFLIPFLEKRIHIVLI